MYGLVCEYRCWWVPLFFRWLLLVFHVLESNGEQQQQSTCTSSTMTTTVSVSAAACCCLLLRLGDLLVHVLLQSAAVTDRSASAVLVTDDDTVVTTDFAFRHRWHCDDDHYQHRRVSLLTAQRACQRAGRPTPASRNSSTADGCSRTSSLVDYRCIECLFVRLLCCFCCCC